MKSLKRKMHLAGMVIVLVCFVMIVQAFAGPSLNIIKPQYRILLPKLTWLSLEIDPGATVYDVLIFEVLENDNGVYDLDVYQNIPEIQSRTFVRIEPYTTYMLYYCNTEPGGCFPISAEELIGPFSVRAGRTKTIYLE